MDFLKSNYFIKLVTQYSPVFCSVYICSDSYLKMPVNFKDEKELKEYLENLGIEYRFGCFSEKKPEVCHLLGDYFDAIKKDFHKAARIYKSNCDDENYPRSCHKYGNYLVKGLGVEKKNEEVAYNYYMKACNLGVGNSCFNAGLMNIRPLPNQNKEKDFDKGLELLDKGCSLGHANACYFLSGLYISGSKELGIAKSMEKAFSYSEKACSLDHLYACMNLITMYKRGEGVEKSEEMANKITKKVEDLKAQLNTPVLLDFQRGIDPV